MLASDDKRKVFLDGYNNKVTIPSQSAAFSLADPDQDKPQKLWPLDAAEYQKGEAIMNDFATSHSFGGFFGRTNYKFGRPDQSTSNTPCGLAYWNIFLVWRSRATERFEILCRVRKLIDLNWNQQQRCLWPPLGVHNNKTATTLWKRPGCHYVTLQGEYTRLSWLKQLSVEEPLQYIVCTGKFSNKLT